MYAPHCYATKLMTGNLYASHMLRNCRGAVRRRGIGTAALLFRPGAVMSQRGTACDAGTNLFSPHRNYILIDLNLWCDRSSPTRASGQEENGNRASFFEAT